MLERDDKYRTNLERLVADELSNIGVAYREQEPVRAGFVLDFVVETASGEICIEADGPTHRTKEGQKKDRFRDLVLKRSGWTVYHLSQDEIINPEKLRSRLKMIICPRMAEAIVEKQGIIEQALD